MAMAWKRVTPAGLSATDAAAGPRGENHAEGGAGEGEQETLAEQLAHDAGARGAEGGAHGEFLLAGGAAGEQEIGEVGAGDEQHESDGTEQHGETGAVVTPAGIFEDSGYWPPAATPVLVSGKSLAMRAEMRRRSLIPWATVKPGLRRPRARMPG